MCMYRYFCVNQFYEMIYSRKDNHLFNICQLRRFRLCLQIVFLQSGSGVCQHWIYVYIQREKQLSVDILNIGVNDRSSKSVFRFTCTIHPIISPPLSICFRHTKSADKCQIRSRKNNSCICKLLDINLFTCGTNINTLCFNDQVD